MTYIKIKKEGREKKKKKKPEQNRIGFNFFILPRKKKVINNFKDEILEKEGEEGKQNFSYR